MDEIEEIELSMVLIFECPGCYAHLIIRDDVRMGDGTECPNCKKKFIVESITGPCRESEDTEDVNAEMFCIR